VALRCALSGDPIAGLRPIRLPERLHWMRFSFPTLREVAIDTGKVIARYPFVVLCAIAGSGAAIVDAEGEGNILPQVIMPASLGLPLMFGLRAFRERTTNRLLRGPLLEILALAALVAYGWTIPSDYDGRPAIIILRYVLLALGLHFAVAFVPCVSGASENEYWEFNRRLFQRFALSLLYTGVLFVGFTLAIASANELFALNIAFRRYGELWILMTGIFNTLFFLGGAQPAAGEGRADATYPRGLRAFAQFALAPLVIVFVVILYLYAIKIARAWSWPHGWVALPVCALAAVGILAALLLQPAREIPAEKWAQWYWKWLFRAMGPLSLLLLLSVRERMSQYGVTEARYFGIVIGLWLLAFSVHYALSPSGSTRWIPSSLCLICFATAFGPWSAFSVSMQSQERILIATLTPFGGIKNGQLVPAAKRLSEKAQDTTKSVIGHLVTTYGIDRLPELFSEYRNARNASKGTLERSANQYANTFTDIQDVMSFLGEPALINNRPYHYEPEINVELDMKGGLPVSGFNKVYRVCACPGSRISAAGDLVFEAPKSKSPLTIRYHGVPLDTSDVERVLQSLHKLDNKAKHTLPPSQLTATLASGTRHWTVIVSSFNAAPLDYGSGQIRQIELYLLDQ
jgi:hypothetical protein